MYAAVPVLALVAASAALADTAQLGRGIGAWKLGQRYVQRAGLVRTELRSENAGPGCVAGPGSAGRIDYYRGLRTAWRSDSRGRLYLMDVATTRAGDRSGDGFVIGLSRLTAVRARHFHAVLRYEGGALSLGKTSLTVMRSTGHEMFAELVYWFDLRGVLEGLETLVVGC